MNSQKPTAAFVGASWAAAALGILAYIIGLWNADISLSEKGYYLTLILYGLFSVISLQKSVRDRHEGIPVTDIYYGLSWVSTIAAILLLVIGLWNASLTLSEKGFYGMAYALSLFAVITVQKNTRDLAILERRVDQAAERRRIQESTTRPPAKKPAQQSNPPQPNVPRPPTESRSPKPAQSTGNPASS